MNRVCTFSLFALIAAMISIPARADGPIEQLQVGNWSGGSYTDNQTKRFSHCAAGTTYNSGIYFMVGVTRGYGWSLIFANKAWKLTPGETIPLEIVFDGRQKYDVSANVLDNNGAIVPMPNEDNLIRDFRKARGMDVKAQGQRFTFLLDGTSRLLPALVDCVHVNVARESGGGDSSGFASSNTGHSNLSSFDTAAPTSASPGSGDTGLAFQMEAVELATNFILASRLEGPRVLSRKDTPAQLASFGAAWKADNAVGTVRIVPPASGINGIDVTAAVVSDDAKTCKGNFASGRMSELVDSEVVYRGFSSCEESGRSLMSQYFVLPRQQGGFILFSVVADASAPTGKASLKDERLAGYREAAYKAVKTSGAPQ
jgi:hypothetical protein